MYLIYLARTNTKVRGEDILRAQQTLQSGKRPLLKIFIER